MEKLKKNIIKENLAHSQVLSPRLTWYLNIIKLMTL